MSGSWSVAYQLEAKVEERRLTELFPRKLGVKNKTASSKGDGVSDDDEDILRAPDLWSGEVMRSNSRLIIFPLSFNGLSIPPT